MAKKSDIHVSKHGSNWKLTQNSERLSTHQTQANANVRAIQHAKRDGVDVVIHGRDGKIRSKDSYGDDPNPPKDTEN